LIPKVFAIITIFAMIPLSLPFFSLSAITEKNGLIMDYTGDYITQDQYENRFLQCQKMQFEDELDASIDCSTYVLTEEGAYKMYYNLLIDRTVDKNKVLRDLLEK
jgi:hypothetical protein